VSPGRLSLRGELTFTTVEQLDEPVERLRSAQQAGRVDVDLGGVTRADSAGLALLVGFIAAARESQFSVAFRGVPDRLQAIARISEVDALLEQGAPAA
jgi:phospholipid transport system transporter-binding protein